MPQVTVPQPTNLMEMFQSPSMMLGDIAMNNVNQYRRANELNMAQAQQEADFAKQKQPYELAKMFNENEEAKAKLPGIKAQSSVLEDQAGISRSTVNKQRQAKLSELAKTISDAQITEAENGIRQMLVHPDPQIRKQGQTLFEGFKGVREEYLKEQERRKTSLSGIGAQIKGQKELEQMRIDAGKYDRRNGSTDFWINFGKLKSSRDKHAALVLEATKYMQEGDTTNAEKLSQMAESIRPQAEAEIANLNVKPGTVDVNKLTQGKVPTAPEGSIAPPASPKPARQFTEQDQAAYQWAKSNPNDPRAAAILQKLGVK